MLSVGLSEEGFAPYENQIRAQFGKVDVVVACINSPKNITVSGKSSQLDWLKQVLSRDQVVAKSLRVDVAYHSPEMQEVADKYLQLIGKLEADDQIVQTVPMISSVTGEHIPIGELKESRYWVRNMVQPVRFSDALSKFCVPRKLGNKCSRTNTSKALETDLLEIGPHNALRAPIRDILRSFKAEQLGYYSVMTRSVSAEDTFLELVGSLWCAGHSLSVSKVNHGVKGARDTRMSLPNLPEYPFNHSHEYWRESRSSRTGYRKRKYPRLDLLGCPVVDFNSLEARWKNVIRPSYPSWVQDHKVRSNLADFIGICC